MKHAKTTGTIYETCQHHHCCYLGEYPLNRYCFLHLYDRWYNFSPFLTASDWMVMRYVIDSISPLDEERLLEDEE